MKPVVPYRTPVDAAEVHPAGWERLPSGAWVTRLPLLDAELGGAALAHLTYRDALHAAELHGARLPTRAEVYEATHVAALVLRPVTLSHGPEMVTREHAELHDRMVAEQLATRRWDGRSLVAGAGKHWVAGASPGRARIAGWWTGTHFIQGGFSDVHLDTHHDYATTTVLARDTEPAVDDDTTTPIPDTDPSQVLPARPLGERALDVAREMLLQGIREVPGPGSSAQVSAFLYPARRGGTPVAGILDATGARLGLVDDATAWCAAFASYCLALAIDGTDERDRAACPHGYRVAVAELVQDARARGTWRPSGYRPAPGDLAIWRRAGGDPTRGGTGHVARVLSADALGFRCIGGNEQDAVRESAHTWGEPSLVGWVAY